MHCKNTLVENNDESVQRQMQLQYFLTVGGLRNHIKSNHKDYTTKAVTGYKDGIAYIFKKVTNQLFNSAKSSTNFTKQELF